MPESILPEVSPASIPAPWPHPVAWTIRLYTASGDVAAELVRTPHQPFILHGDAELFSLLSAEILHAIAFFAPQPPYVHGLN